MTRLFKFVDNTDSYFGEGNFTKDKVYEATQIDEYAVVSTQSKRQVIAQPDGSFIDDDGRDVHEELQYFTEVTDGNTHNS